MTRHRTLFMTERSRFHQQLALDAAPAALDIVMLRQPEPAELTAQLAEALRSRHLAGTALATFEWEPVKPDNPLRLMAVADPEVNVLLTPHTANGTASRGALPANGRARDYEPLLRFLAGRPVPNRLAWRRPGGRRTT